MTAEVELVRYRTENGTRPALIVEGRKWIQVVTFDTPISVHKVRIRERRFMTADLQFHDKPYPLRRAARLFRKAAKVHGITKGAKTIIRAAAAA